MEPVNSNCSNAETNSMDYQVKMCYGCKKPIEDQYRFKVSPNMEWHATCLACYECQKFLDESGTCFVKEGKPYCRQDYIRLFGIKCSNCAEHILSSDMVMRAKNQIFHLNCFRCSSCACKLIPGEEFGFSNGKLFCKSDFDLLPMEIAARSPPSDVSSGSEGSGMGNANSAPNKGPQATTKRSNSEKGPRVRTVLTEQQLQTLRTVYASNPRPDALLKEHLVEITGLNPRVIRVWFQNKRCKDKKKAIQQAEVARMQQQQQGATKVIPPLTPQTPITPDGMGQISPHPGMPAFTYPAAPYDMAQPMVTTPTSAVSPIVTCYQHNPAWGSPTDTISPFDHGDFSSPMTTEHQQSFIYSSAQTTQPNHFAF